jgi:hypothetical protein
VIGVPENAIILVSDSIYINKSSLCNLPAQIEQVQDKYEQHCIAFLFSLRHLWCVHVLYILPVSVHIVFHICNALSKFLENHIRSYFFFQTLNFMFLYNSYKPITNTMWVSSRLCKLQKGCIRLAPASDKVYQLLVHGRWFSPGTPSSSTTKTIRHDIAEILLKVALNTIHQSN